MDHLHTPILNKRKHLTLHRQCSRIHVTHMQMVCTQICQDGKVILRVRASMLSFHPCLRLVCPVPWPRRSSVVDLTVYIRQAPSSITKVSMRMAASWVLWPISQISQTPQPFLACKQMLRILVISFRIHSSSRKALIDQVLVMASRCSRCRQFWDRLERISQCPQGILWVDMPLQAQTLAFSYLQLCLI